MTEPKHKLVLDLELDAPRDKIFACWQDPEILRQWWCPKPWTVPFAEFELKTGAAFRTIMRSPEGEEVDNRGMFLEVVPGEKIVFTDAFTSAWVPSEKPFIVATITYEDIGNNRTRFRAVVGHWSEEDCKRHEEMGFIPGWTQVAHQLAEIARSR